MKVLLLVAIFILPLHVYAGKWVAFNYGDLYSLSKNQNSEIIGITSLSLPKGKQAIVTIMQSTQSNKALFKCIDYYSADMQPIKQKCYTLEKE